MRLRGGGVVILPLRLIGKYMLLALIRDTFIGDSKQIYITITVLYFTYSAVSVFKNNFLFSGFGLH